MEPIPNVVEELALRSSVKLVFQTQVFFLLLRKFIFDMKGSFCAISQMVGNVSVVA
jgi:hypothetical protein